MQTKDLEAYFDSLREDQLQHLDYLSKFTTKALVNQEKYSPAFDTQTDFISQNYSIMSIDEQVAYNDIMRQKKKVIESLGYIFGGSILISTVVGLALSSPTQRLRKYVFAGAGIGAVASTAYYLYMKNEMKEKIDRTYFLIHLRMMRAQGARPMRQV